jgi:hypothetical protein
VQDICPAFDDDLDGKVDDFTMEEGDRVFMAMVHLVDPHHFVHASSTVSGRLAEAFAKNSKPKGFEDIVLMTLHEYADVFSETTFNSLPKCCKWDHAIELEREPSPGFHKVYPMTLAEQTEMDAFLEEALATGHIRQSKSPLGAPVFFIKKKDGKLHFCKGTSVHFLTSPLLSYSPPVHMYSISSPLYHLQGLHPKPTTSRPWPDDFLDINSPEVNNFRSPHCSDLNSTARFTDASGQVHVTLWHPPPSHGHPYMGGLVLGGLIL